VWYEASSVIAAIRQCEKLTITSLFIPSCPKGGNNTHCLENFPNCEGKTFRCSQSLEILSENGGPSILFLSYYTSDTTRQGKIKKMNSTLRWLITRYGVNEALMAPV